MEELLKIGTDNGNFDPSSDLDIEEFISEVKSLQTLLDLPNQLVVTTLKEKFPSHRLLIDYM